MDSNPCRFCWEATSLTITPIWMWWTEKSYKDLSLTTCFKIYKPATQVFGYTEISEENTVHISIEFKNLHLFIISFLIIFWYYTCNVSVYHKFPESLMVHWPAYRSFNPETCVRFPVMDVGWYQHKSMFPVEVTTFYFTLNEIYTDFQSSRKKSPFFSMILHVYLSQQFQRKNLKKIAKNVWKLTLRNPRHRQISECR